MHKLIQFLFLLGLAFPGWVTPAEATFPGVEIALWDPHFAKQDRSDPRYVHILDLAQKKQFAEAVQEAQRLIQERPQKGTPLILKALLLYELQNYREAFFTLQQGRAIQPRHPAIHYAHCELYRHLGTVELSDRACKISVNQHPKSPEAHYEKALTHAAQGQMKEANQELAEAQELDPKNPAYPFEMGMNWTYLNLPDQARPAFEKTLELDPDHLDAAYQLGYLHATRNNIAEAEKYLNRVYDTRRDHPKVDAARILLEYLNKNDPSSLPAKVDPANYHLSRSNKLYQERDFGLSLFEIQTAARLNPDDSATQQILVGMASLLIRVEVAEKAVEHLINTTGDNPQLQAKGYQELGDLKLIQGDLGQARKAYQEAVRLGDPGELAKASLAELPAPGKVAPFRHSDQWLLNPLEALNNKGEAFAHYGMYNRAIALYGMALRMDPNHLDSKLNTATAYYNSGQFNRAIALLEKIMITHPDHPHLFSHRILLARAYAQQNDIAEAVRNLELASGMNAEEVRTLKSDPAFKELRNNPVFK